MSKKPLPPKYLTPFQPFHCTKDFLGKIAGYFPSLTKGDDEEKKKLIRLGEQIKTVIDSHLFYKYSNQVKANEIRNYLEKKEGTKLIKKAKELLKIIEGMPEPVFRDKSLKILKEQLEFLTEPNSELYSREACESGFISEYEIAYLNQRCTAQEKRLAEPGNEKKAFSEMMEILICDEDEVSVKIPIPQNGGEELSDMEMLKKKPVARPIIGKKKEQRRISKLLRQIFTGFYFPKPLDNSLKESQKNFVDFVLKVIGLDSKEKGTTTP